MSDLPNCPECGSEYTYQDQTLYVCPMCHFEWTEADAARAEEAAKTLDANGSELFDGDTVTIIKDVRLSGKDRLRQGDKAKNIRILDEPVDGHDIEGSIDGLGRLYLKSEIVRK